MFPFVISALETADEIEVVERKGAGHPDSICDALAETLSRNLCREYRNRIGEILHHNVDKALLCGGRAAPAFGGGAVVEPIRIYLAGRATDEARGLRIPVQEIAIEGSRAWLRSNLHALDPERDVRIQPVLQRGSQHLQTLFERGGRRQVPLANDTSFGVGHAPLSAVERLVLAIERRINARDKGREAPAWGEDVKVMAVRRGRELDVTIACAMIGRFLSGPDEYLQNKAEIESLTRELAEQSGFSSCKVAVNTADHALSGEVYLTVTGTSAEGGDDGEVGRGNRVNGLITPCRPMSLEAAAGKNPVSHVGKLYNVLAGQISEILVQKLPQIERAECLLVSRIGDPVSQPALVQIKLASRDGVSTGAVKPRIEEIVSDRLNRVADLVEGFIDGSIGVY